MIQHCCGSTQNFKHKNDDLLLLISMNKKTSEKDQFMLLFFIYIKILPSHTLLHFNQVCSNTAVSCFQNLLTWEEKSTTRSSLVLIWQINYIFKFFCLISHIKVLNTIFISKLLESLSKSLWIVKLFLIWLTSAFHMTNQSAGECNFV